MASRKSRTSKKSAAPRRAVKKAPARAAKKKSSSRKTASAVATTSRELVFPTLHESTTSSGLKVIAAERGPLPLVSMRLVIRAGSSTDPEGKHGIADFAGQLLRRGTRRLNAQAIDEAVEFVGASLGVGVGEDTLSVAITTPAEHFAQMLGVMGQLVMEPTFPESEVADARERALAQFANDLDEPSVIADRALVRALWGKHPYGHNVSGSVKTVSTFTRDDVVRFHQERLGPKVAMLVVVGAVDPGRVAAAAEEAFAGWTGGPDKAPVIPPLEKVAKAGRVIVVDKPDQTQSQVRMGGPGYRTGHEDYFPAAVMNTALGGGFTSRLMNEVRVNRGLTYGIGCWFDAMHAAGIFALSTFTKTESTREIIDVSLGEIAKVRDSGLKPTELRDAQAYMGGLYPLRTETNESIASAISDIRLNGLGDDWVLRFRDRLKAVTPRQVAAVAKKYCFAEPPTIVVLGNAAAVKKQLKGLGPITVVPASEYE
ncbi:pitrilysin family protein [Myxococcus sp. AS-1-15]|uniref:M16 family metallopeptidase n=1 Tax=Myxococcus sp. AS-1-15 TaxID=2874600 RepID=UPI001CBAC7EC|nr:pitrilysin family protein [Myxococcus sp. AS-1-15]MBZ4397497.1 insulinase family protein [Myxococcus sp. AS-1-15]BDT34735.1 insulinase family protein [Myxococcus sp. MH1]